MGCRSNLFPGANSDVCLFGDFGAMDGDYQSAILAVIQSYSKAIADHLSGRLSWSIVLSVIAWNPLRRSTKSIQHSVKLNLFTIASRNVHPDRNLDQAIT